MRFVLSVRRLKPRPDGPRCEDCREFAAVERRTVTGSRFWCDIHWGYFERYRVKQPTETQQGGLFA